MHGKYQNGLYLFKVTYTLDVIYKEICQLILNLLEIPPHTKYLDGTQWTVSLPESKYEECQEKNHSNAFDTFSASIGINQGLRIRFRGG